MAPKISIILPCYNAERFIEDTILSIINQTFYKWECIIINDGSTDKSHELISKLIINDSRFKLINQDNKGLSFARNIGLENAKGEYIYFLDADDLLHQNSLNILTNYLYNEIEILTAKTATTIGHNKTIVDFLKHPNDIKNFNFSSFDILLLAVEHGITCTVQNRLIKKDFLLKNNIKFKENLLHEDELFFFELFYHASNIKFINEVTYFYNIGNSDSITKNFAKKNLIDCLSIINEIYQNYYQNNSIKDKEIIALYIQNFKRLIFDYLKRLTDTEKNEMYIEIKQLLEKTPILRNYNLLNKGFEKRLYKFNIVSFFTIKNIIKYQYLVQNKSFLNGIFANCLFYYSLFKLNKIKEFFKLKYY